MHKIKHKANASISNAEVLEKHLIGEYEEDKEKKAKKAKKGKSKKAKDKEEEVASEQ